MRLPHVVGMPVVVKTSLTATGQPASGPSLSPALRLASMSCAWLRAWSAATCRKACTRSSTAAIRSRWARVTSVAETSPVARAAASSAAVIRVSSIVLVLPQDARHLEPLLLHRGGLVERLLGGQARDRHVVAEHVGHAGRVRGRRDAVGRDLLDLRDGRDDLVQLGGQVVEFRVAERDPGQSRQMRDLLTGDGHARHLRVGAGAVRNQIRPLAWVLVRWSRSSWW